MALPPKKKKPGDNKNDLGWPDPVDKDTPAKAKAKATSGGKPPQGPFPSGPPKQRDEVNEGGGRVPKSVASPGMNKVDDGNSPGNGTFNTPQGGGNRMRMLLDDDTPASLGDGDNDENDSPGSTTGDTDVECDRDPDAVCYHTEQETCQFCIFMQGTNCIHPMVNMPTTPGAACRAFKNKGSQLPTENNEAPGEQDVDTGESNQPLAS